MLRLVYQNATSIASRRSLQSLTTSFLSNNLTSRTVPRSRCIQEILPKLEQYKCFSTNVGRVTPLLCDSSELRKLTLGHGSPLSANYALDTRYNQNGSLLSTFTQIRTVTKFSLTKGKRKSVKAVVKRFKRLNWGGWIRTRSGRRKKLWKKSASLKRRLRQHVFVNGTQSWLLDKMVTRFWKKPKYYVDDPYEPYHTRDEYFATKSKPKY